MRSYNIHAAEQKKVLLDAKIYIHTLCIMSVSIWIGPLSEMPTVSAPNNNNHEKRKTGKAPGASDSGCGRYTVPAL